MSNAKRCKLTGCTNVRGGHKSIYKGLCAEHAAAAERLGNAERSRWFVRRLAKAGALGVLLLGCARPDFESPEVADLSAATPASDGFCVRSDEQHAPSSADCYRVTAASGSVLANCFGDDWTPITNEELTPRGPGFITTAFDVTAGGCFYFYACDGATFDEAAPSVEVCP